MHLLPVASIGLVLLGAVTDGVTLFCPLKTDDLFYIVTTSTHSARLPSDCFLVPFVKFSRKFLFTFIRVSLLDDVTRAVRLP